MSVKITKEKRKQLYKLLRQWTRAEIISRHGRFDNLEFADYYGIMLDKENEIRKLLYGDDSLYNLGVKWELVVPFEDRPKQKSAHPDKIKQSHKNKKKKRNK